MGGIPRKIVEVPTWCQTPGVQFIGAPMGGYQVIYNFSNRNATSTGAVRVQIGRASVSWCDPFNSQEEVITWNPPKNSGQLYGLW